MKDSKSSKHFKEGLRKFKHRVGYTINESPRYRSLVGSNEEFDEIPTITNEAGNQENAPKLGGGEVPPVTSLGMGEPPASNAGAPRTVPNGPAETPPGADAPTAGGGTMPEPPIGGPQAADVGTSMPPEQQVDDIQNDIIKHNIAAMQSIHDQLEGLNSTVSGLNAKLEKLSSDVEEVREPTNTEKLMSKTNVSYPYYFNLNDFWSGNWFNEKRKAERERGVRELPDGTFIADFDDLPQNSKIDVQNSFNNY